MEAPDPATGAPDPVAVALDPPRHAPQPPLALWLSTHHAIFPAQETEHPRDSLIWHRHHHPGSPPGSPGDVLRRRGGGGERGRGASTAGAKVLLLNYPPLPQAIAVVVARRCRRPVAVARRCCRPVAVARPYRRSEKNGGEEEEVEAVRVV